MHRPSPQTEEDTAVERLKTVSLVHPFLSHDTLTPRQRTTDTGSPSFEFDSLGSTPEHPSSPMPGDLTGESSSVGSHLSASQDRPFLARTVSSHSQQDAEGGFVATSGTRRGRPSYPSPGSLGHHRNTVLQGREDIDQVLLSK